MKGVPLTEELYQYLCEFGAAEDTFLQQLNREAAAEGIPQIQISPEQLAFIQVLLRILRARFVVEVGSLAGYSTLGMLRVLPPEGILYAFEQNERYARFIRNKYQQLQPSAQLHLVVGDAHQTLATAAFPSLIDFVFLDADKTGYRHYWELLEPYVRVGGVIAADNALMAGDIITSTPPDPDVAAMQQFNQFVKAHPRYASCIVPVGDGMIVAVKLSE